MIFVSIPYSHPDENVVRERIRILEHYVMWMLKKKEIAISPVLHYQCFIDKYRYSTSYEFWKVVCREWMCKCSSVNVLKIEGWDVSVGVQDEVSMAEELLLDTSSVDVSVGDHNRCLFTPCLSTPWNL